MPGAFTQAVSLSVFLFATLGNQFSADIDDYDGVPWGEMAQGAVAAGALFLATISTLAFTQKELLKAYETLKPLFNMRSAGRNHLPLPPPSAPPQSVGRALIERIALMTNICLRLSLFMLLMVVATCVVAMVLADTPGWATFIHNLPLDSAAKFVLAVGNGLKSFGVAIGVKLLDQLTSENSFLLRLLPASMTHVCMYTGAILVETVRAVSILGRNAWLLLSAPVNYLSSLSSADDGTVAGPLRFFLGWVCWHGGYLMPWQPYSVGAGIATKRALHGAANSLTAELSILAYPCLTAMGAMAMVMAVFSMKILGPVCAKYRSVYRVSQFHLLIAVVCATHVFCFFSFDTVRALALKAHPVFGLDNVPEHDNFNWISSNVYDPLNPSNVHTLARPLQLFCDIAVAATMLTMGYLYRDPAGGSIFRRRRRSSVEAEMDVTSCSGAVDDSPVCSAAGMVSNGLEEVSNDARGTGGASSDPEEEERNLSHMHEETGGEHGLAKVQEESGRGDEELEDDDDDDDGEEEEEEVERESRLEKNESRYDEGAEGGGEEEEEEEPLQINQSLTDDNEEPEPEPQQSYVTNEEDYSEGEDLLRRTKPRSYLPRVHTPVEHSRMVTRAAARSQQQLQQAPPPPGSRARGSVRERPSVLRLDPAESIRVGTSAAGGRRSRVGAGGVDSIDSVLGTTSPRRRGGDMSSSAATPNQAAAAAGYALSRQERTQVAMAELSQAGTGGQGDKEYLQREYSQHVHDVRRLGRVPPPPFTSQSSASHLGPSDGSETSSDVHLLDHAPATGPSWGKDATVVAGESRASLATRKNMAVVGRASLIPQVAPQKRGVRVTAAGNENYHPRTSPFTRAS